MLNSIKRYGGIITVIFIGLLSVWVRLPNYDSKLIHRHESLSGHVLATLSIWEKTSPSVYFFSPVFTFDNVGDKYQLGVFKRGVLFDGKGNLYYLSYPSFGFIFPYILFKATFSAPSVAGLQVINYTLHIIGSIGIYVIVANVIGKKQPEKLYPWPLFASIVYLFSPNSLWFGGNVYFSDMLAQALWVIAIYLALQLVDTQGFRLGISLAVVTFLLVTTEWIGIFFGAGVVLVFLFQKHTRKASILLGVIIATSLVCTFLQYSQISGSNKYLLALKDKFAARTGLLSTEQTEMGITFMSEFGLNNIKKYYLEGYYFTLILLGIFTVVSFYKIHTFSSESRPKIAILFFCVLLPIVLHHALLFNFTAIHEFSVFKSAVLFAITLGILGSLITERSPQIYSFCIVLLLGTLFIGYNSKIYYEQNPEGAVKSVLLENYATEIAGNVKTDEAIFADYWLLDAPAIQYFAKRNIVVCPNKDCVTAKMKEYNHKKAVYVRTFDTGVIQSYMHFENTSEGIISLEENERQ